MDERVYTIDTEQGMSVTIRIPPDTHEQLQRLASDRKQPIGQVVAAAVAHLESERFWDAMEAAFEQLYADPDAAATYDAERRAWDVTLLDGLDEDTSVDEAGDA